MRQLVYYDRANYQLACIGMQYENDAIVEPAEDVSGETKRRKPGRPQWRPTERDRRQVELLAGLGLLDSEIGRVLGVAPQTVQRHCAEEIACGRAKLKARIGAALVRAATDAEKPNVVAAIWLEKTRFGMREPTDVPKKVLAHEVARTADQGSNWEGLLQ